MIDRGPFENERKALAQIALRLEDLPDDQLADAAQLAGEMAEFYETFNKSCQRELLRRMDAEGRKILVTWDWLCEREATLVYDYADGGERTRDVLVSILGPAEAERYVTWEPPKPSEGRWKVDTRKLLALLNKVAPHEADAIRSTFTVIEKNPKVRFKRIESGEE